MTDKEQLSMDGLPPKIPKTDKNIKLNWEKAFQKWCDEQLNDGLTCYGKCGYGIICDYCEGEEKPCIRALKKMYRERNMTIDYSKRNFEEIWDDR